MPSMTPEEYLNKAKGQMTSIPRPDRIQLTSENVEAVLTKHTDVSADAVASTVRALKTLQNIPGTNVEIGEGRVFVNTPGTVGGGFEMPVFGAGNTLTKGGTSWMSVRGVNEFDAAGQGNYQRFFNWFNNAISDMAGMQGLDVKTKQQRLADKVARVFGGDPTKGQADAGRAMVEPMAASGQNKLSQVVSKGYVDSISFATDSEVGRLYHKAEEARMAVFKASSGDRALPTLINTERVAREAYLKAAFTAAGIAPHTGRQYADFTFSATGRATIDPVFSRDRSTMTLQMSGLHHSDITTMSDASQYAKGFSQMRHAAYHSHDKLKKAKASMRHSREGVKGAHEVDRITGIISTRARVDMDQAASDVMGKKMTSAPMARVGTFLDPEMNAAFLKDSGGIRSASSFLNEPVLSNMGRSYVKRVHIGSDDFEVLKGMLDEKVVAKIQEQIGRAGSRQAGKTYEFGTFGTGQSSNKGLGLTIDSGILGFDQTTTTIEGIPSKEEAAQRAVRLRNKGDIIQGIKIRDNVIEFAVESQNQQGNLGQSLLIGEEAKRITAARTMDLRVAGGGLDILADLEAFEGYGDGMFGPEGIADGAMSGKSGSFYRRQLSTVAARIERQYGESGLRHFAESFGLTMDDRFQKSPTLVLEPGAENVSFTEGMLRFKERFGKITGSGPGDTHAEKVRDLFKVQEEYLDDRTVQQLLREKGFIDTVAGGAGVGGLTHGTIIDPKTNTHVPLDSDRGKEIFRGFRERMKIAVFEDTVNMRIDRVTSVGIKEDGRSAARIGASRLGYVKEAVQTRGMNAPQGIAKVLHDFDQLIINRGMVEANPVVFEELARLASPFRGSAGLGTMTPKTMAQIGAQLGSAFPDLASIRSQRGSAGKPVAAHLLKGSILYDDSIKGLRQEGFMIDLGHSIDIMEGRPRGGDTGAMPKSVKTSKIYIPSPANVLNVDRTKSTFMPTGDKSQGAYVKLIERIAQFSKDSVTTNAQAAEIGRLYNEFSVAYAEEAYGKTGKFAKAALDPTFARYGALSSLPHLKADEVGLTRESFEEMLRKSSFSEAQKERIRARAESGDLRLGYLADPMGSREHYRGVRLNLLDDQYVSPRVPGQSSVPTAKDVMYVSDAILTMSNRDLDADHATLSLLSSISEHTQGKAGLTEEEAFNLDQRALEAMEDLQRPSITAIQNVADQKALQALSDGLEHGARTDARDIMLMGDEVMMTGADMTPGAIAANTVARTDPGVRTPIPEVWWHKLSGVTEVVYGESLAAQAGTGSKQDALKSIVDTIVRRSRRTDVNEGEMQRFVEIMMESSGQTSQYHNTLKYQMLLKTANQTEAQMKQSLTFWEELGKAVNQYNYKGSAADLANDSLDNLTAAIVDVMKSGKEISDFAGAAKYPTGIEPGVDVIQFARTTAREIVAGSMINIFSGYSNPHDYHAKQAGNLLGVGENLAANDATRVGERTVSEAGAYGETFLRGSGAAAPGYRLSDEIADANTFESMEGARRAGANVRPSRTAEQVAQAAAESAPQGQPGLGEYISRTKGTIIDLFEKSKVFFQNSQNARFAAGAVAGVAALEMGRATLTAMRAPQLSVPTAPLPPEPLLAQPGDPTFDSGMLPQQNRTRIQRTTGMRSHAHVNGAADDPTNFRSLPQPVMGGHSTPPHSSATYRDGRSNRTSHDEEARRRLYAAY